MKLSFSSKMKKSVLVQDSIMQKQNILGMDLKGLETFFTSIGEKPYRAKQLLKWVHARGVLDFSAMSDFSKELREKLEASAEFSLLEVVSLQKSKDGTRKWLFRLEGKNVIETVYIPDGKRKTLCISSQAGCILNCSFCHTGKQGFSRNLSAAEIMAQLWYANHSLIAEGEVAADGRGITNVVMMGMGEPLLNTDNVITALKIMVDDLAYGLSKRRVTVSTSGVVPGILQLAKETYVAFALSLHAPNNKLRSELVPLNKKYPLEVLLPTCKEFIDSYPQEKHVTIEYVMLDGVNDSLKEAKEMSALLHDLPVKINLIPFNPFPNSGYVCSKPEQIEKFADYLRKRDYIVTVRRTRGDDIAGACGQLAGDVIDKTKRRAKFEAQYQKLNITTQDKQS